MSSPHLSSLMRPMAIEKGDETAVVLPSPVYNNSNGGFTKSWRLNSETFETQKKTEAQIEGLHRRLPKHFNAGSKDGIVAYYRRQNQLVEQFQVGVERSQRDETRIETFPSHAAPRRRHPVNLPLAFFYCFGGDGRN
jgi:hypothetical protein